MTDTEEQAIELVEEKLKLISSSFNMQVFSIAQVNKGVLNDTKWNNNETSCFKSSSWIN